MRPVAVLLFWALALAGCMTPFCGPPSYFVSPAAVSTVFSDETWNATTAEAGLREAGFERQNGTHYAVVVGGPIRVTHNEAMGRIEFYAEFGESRSGLTREEADQHAAQLETTHGAEAEAMLDAFERGTGWSADAPLSWNSGPVGHGDC